MKPIEIRRDFLLIPDYFDESKASRYLKWIFQKGSDPRRGFHHPDLKPNRFHAKPKYPVKKYFCLGWYWNPLDYQYHRLIPTSGVRPFPIPAFMKTDIQQIVNHFFPYKGYEPETALVNFYSQNSSMGLHVDRDEEDQEAPVVGMNFGSECRFFYETPRRALQEVRIPGNSIYLFGQSARMMRHGVGTLYARTRSPGSEAWMGEKERLNLTFRKIFR